MSVRTISVNAAVLSLFSQNRIHFRAPSYELRHPKTLSFYDGCLIESYSHVFSGLWLPYRLGAFSYSQDPIPRHVIVGRHCSIASDVIWVGEQHPTDRVSTHPLFFDPDALQGVQSFYRDRGANPVSRSSVEGLKYVIVNADVWIGTGASIMSGVQLGVGCVVAAGAVVTKDVAPYMIVAGVPARPLRRRFPDDLAEQLVESRWWNFSPIDLAEFDFASPRVFVERLNAARASLQPLSLPVLSGAELLAAAETEEAAPRSSPPLS